MPSVSRRKKQDAFGFNTAGVVAVRVAEMKQPKCQVAAANGRLTGAGCKFQENKGGQNVSVLSL